MRTRLFVRFLLVLTVSVGALGATPYGEGASATITVDTASDVIASDGLCSLREAIVAANTDSPFSDCPGGSGADTLLLDPRVLQTSTLTLAIGGGGEDDARTGDLDLAGRLTISATSQILLDGQSLDRLFHVLPGAQVTLSGLTVRNGNPGATAHGGGLLVDRSSTLTLTHSTVISNTALRGGGVKVLGRLNLSQATVDLNQGGGIHIDGGLATLQDARICDNAGAGVRAENVATLTLNRGEVCRNQGGGVQNSASTVALSHVTLAGNTGSGGVHSAGSGTIAAVLNVNTCTIVDNTATNGGGIFSQGINARATINRSDISHNTATSAGGGISNNGLMTVQDSAIHANQARSGGGIDHLGGNLTLTNSTLSGNDAADNGGGLHSRSSAILTNVTFNANTADGPGTGGNLFVDEASVSLVNNILAGSPADGNCFNSSGSLQSLGHNLESADTCGFGAAGDLANVDPRLGPLQENGGPTPTHALLPGSPAIDTGDDDACPAADQRGVTRPQGTACDRGSYETYQAGDTADLSIEKQRQGTGTVAPGGQIRYSLSIHNAGPAAPVHAVVVDAWSPAGAVTGVDAPGCTVDLGQGTATCTYAALGLGKRAPEPIVVLTTDPAFSGVLSNTATITLEAGASDLWPANNTSQTIWVTIADHALISIYLPLITNGSPASPSP